MIWSLVSSYYANLSPSYYVGFAVTSASTGNLSTATFDNLSFMANVPQTTGSLTPQVWLRSDVGVTASGGQVSALADQSGNGNDASQSTGANQPTITAAAVNGVAALNFDGSTSYMTLGPGLFFGSSGITAYVVLNPTATSSTARLFDFGNGAGNFICHATKPRAMVHRSICTIMPRRVRLQSGALTQNVFQSLATVINPSGRPLLCQWRLGR